MGLGSYLMDSNVVIDFFNGKLPVKAKEMIIDLSPEISVITQIEILSNKSIGLDEYNNLVRFVDMATIHQIDNRVVQQTIELRQNYKMKTPDAIIAATAMVLGVPLLSRNKSDFEKIESISLINPWEL